MLTINNKDIKLHSDIPLLIDKIDHEHAHICLKYDMLLNTPWFNCGGYDMHHDIFSVGLLHPKP